MLKNADTSKQCEAKIKEAQLAIRVDKMYIPGVFVNSLAATLLPYLQQGLGSFLGNQMRSGIPTEANL